MPEALPFEEALGRFAHPEDAEAVRAAVARALDPEGDGRLAVEHRCPRPGADGRSDGGAGRLATLATLPCRNDTRPTAS